MSKDSENENERLGREWMASEHWGGWRVGMVCAVTGQVVVRVDDRANIWSDTLPRVAPPGTCPTPDVSHPGTRAFLLEEVLAPNRPNFKTMDHETEQAALIAALRAAPEKTK